MDKALRDAIGSFIQETAALYDTTEIRQGTLIDPPEYLDCCKLCSATEREHNPGCMFYPLFMAM